MQEIKIKSAKREELIDITEKMEQAIKQNNWKDGVVYIYCTHTTAAVTINEAADPSVARDIATCLHNLVPEKGDYQHMEGNSDAHIKSSLLGCSETVLVSQGRPVLGTWQGIFFAEFDGPRTRKVLLQWISK